jgi:transposase
MMPGDDMLTEPVIRRLEVFTGAGRRRKWTAQAKAQIVAESYALSVGEVAERYALSKTQLFTWRRQARDQNGAPELRSSFVPVLVEMPAPLIHKAPRRRSRSQDGGIELEIDGVVVRVGRGAEARTVAAVIKALKAQR